MTEQRMTAGEQSGQPGRDFQLLQVFVQKAEDMIFIKNTELIYVAASEAFARMVGKPVKDILGSTDYDIFTDRQLAEKYRAVDKRILEGRKNIYDMVEPLPDVEGQPQYATTSKELLTDEQGNPLGLVGISRDMGKFESAKQHFWRELQNLLEFTPQDFYIMVADLDSWEIVERRVDPQLEKVVDTDVDLDELICQVRSQAPDNCPEAYAFYRNFSAEYLHELYRCGQSQLVMEYGHALRNGTSQWMQDRVYLRTNPENGHLYCVIKIHSVDAQRQKALRLRQEAQRDSLTGLLNRHYFIRKCEKYLSECGETAEHAFFMIDVDHFKKVNDTYGHQMGDSFLECLAQVLQDSFRPDDLIARLGGDEFVALMRNLPDRRTVRKRADEIIERTRRKIREQTGIEPSISIGISLYPADGVNVEELYGNADIALYKAKLTRDNCCEFYSPQENGVIQG